MAKVEVRIEQTSAGCHAIPDPFKAQRGSDVTFLFDGMSDVFIDFGTDSPFGDTNADAKFPPGKEKKVKSSARLKSYAYTVVWPGGQGNGSGEIIP